MIDICLCQIQRNAKHVRRNCLCLTFESNKIIPLGFKEFQYDDRNYFYSGHDKELKDAKLDWLDSRNTCRERCMETVSFETQAEFDFIKEYIMKNEIKFVWTSGRLCGNVYHIYKSENKNLNF